MRIKKNLSIYVKEDSSDTEVFNTDLDNPSIGDKVYLCRGRKYIPCVVKSFSRLKSKKKSLGLITDNGTKFSVTYDFADHWMGDPDEYIIIENGKFLKGELRTKLKDNSVKVGDDSSLFYLGPSSSSLRRAGIRGY